MRGALLLSFLMLAGCAAPASVDILATFYPLEFVAARLAGANATTASLVPPGIEPHEWEPSPNDIDALGHARLLFVQGAGFEAWLGDTVANLGDRAPRVVTTTSTIELAAPVPAEGEAEEMRPFDPHTWLAPRLFARQLAVMEDAIAAELPEAAADVHARGAALRAELASLDADFASGLAHCDAHVIIANHDAYSYLAREYGFEVVALAGLSPEAEPDPGTIARAVEVAREHNLTIVFFEELVSPRVAEVVAHEVGAETRVLSPVESAPAEGDYVTLMRQNLVELREAMRCT